jgi:hypothetical protein
MEMEVIDARKLNFDGSSSRSADLMFNWVGSMYLATVNSILVAKSTIRTRKLYLRDCCKGSFQAR